MGKEIAEGVAEAVDVGTSISMKEYMASLRYAGMIQRSMLPLPALMKALFSDYFVLYKPRDYVSGDFYYVYRGKSYFCVAAGDCTGHGVPGALLSIMGINYLKEILQCQQAPRANRVLNVLREKVMSTLHQTGSPGEPLDSIDLALCIFEYDSFEMQYSGANRPLFIAGRDGIREIRPDKMPIGLAPLKEEPFSNYVVTYTPRDMFYLFSDGYPDQFGGPDNKKFKYKQFRKLLTDISDCDVKTQNARLESAFMDWKGDGQQIDDVMIFGFKPKIKR